MISVQARFNPAAVDQQGRNGVTTPTSNHTNQRTDPETGQSGKAGIDQELFHKTVGRYASDITIITSHDSQGPIGFTCQSFYSVSVEPPWCPSAS